ncbi:hypothetical protein E2F46_15100 [Luteimonas aestuarii]|uniref:Uncharacterized protein n=1 Tax=Luteimonas aestuarii TaxID=453837 RepID=A0A4R5TRW1_9GAMM|nr:hypothetical protein [Luteimonas aestuarii]TDK21557.1 hypothetical protein E2F46_15100 [Luteimonas aestuarii]
MRGGLLLGLLLCLPPCLANGIREDPPHTELAAEYVAGIDQVRWLLAILTCDPAFPFTPVERSPELDLGCRIGAALTHDGIRHALVRVVAEHATHRELREAIAYTKTAEWKIEGSCKVKFPNDPDYRKACIREQVDERQLRIIETTGAREAALRAHVLDTDGGFMGRGIRESIDALETQDPAVFSGFRKECVGFGPRGFCDYILKAGSP